MLFKKKDEEEKIDEMIASLKPAAYNYLQAHGLKSVPLIRHEGFPAYRIIICTVNPTSYAIPVAGANVIFTYCSDRDIAAEKLYDAAITLKPDEAYKLVVSLKLEGY